MLPPAYVVRREGNSFTLLVCPHLGGGSVQPGGGVSPAGGVRSVGGDEVSQPAGGVRSVSSGRGGSGQSAGGGGGGSAKIGQQNEYSLLHGGRYASCVHAEGLSCYSIITLGFFSSNIKSVEKLERKQNEDESLYQ